MTWQYIQTDGKTTLYSNNKNSLLFRHGSVTKKASEPSHEIKMAKLELACLKALNQLPEEDKEEAIDDLEEALEEDETELEEKRKEDIEEKPKKRRFDDPEDALIKSIRDDATIQPKFSALEYKVGSLGFEPIGENGDQLMLDLGCY